MNPRIADGHTQLDRARLLQLADPHSDSDAEAAIAIARALLVRSRELQTPQERRQQAELDRMIGHPGDKATLVEMTDQAFRTHSAARVADQLTHLLDVQGIPRFFSPLEQTMLRGFQTFGGYLPGVAVPLVKDKMRHETANVILPAEEQPLREHLAARQASGLRMNVNFLGEALLGEAEAQRRLEYYLHALQIPEIACISVKLSTIYSQVSTIARRHTIELISDRLELLYRAALREPFTAPDGGKTSKFVYLDMEEYRDLYLTAEVFRETLGREGLSQARGGIALQAYIPDSYAVLLQLIDWSRQRVAAGGTPITIRLVKGANLEMERVEASVGGYPQTPYLRKVDTDANFKRMLRALIDAAAEAVVRVGVASHNLFDIALALLWGNRAGSGSNALDQMQFEMLEGMANHQRRALFEPAPSMLLYAPACRREDFLHAIGYLIRRLDENTGEENFLRHSFKLSPDSETWQMLAAGFRESLAMIDSVSSSPRRTQDRFQSPVQPPAAADWTEFVNEPDTDWSLPHHSRWAESIVARWKPRCDDQATTVPLAIAGQLRSADSDSDSGTATPADRQLVESFDPSRPGTIACRFTQAGERDVEDAIAFADADPDGWRNRSAESRREILRRAAQRMRERRGDLIGAMMIDGGKLITEADPEVSEAIDFTEFYSLAALNASERSRRGGSPVRLRPRGTVAVISPWNFPLAIPCGGTAASLAAGNTVILKPASDTVLPAYELCKCFWDAGVPPSALQLVPCRGSGAGKRLVADRRVDAVVLTGGTETAKQMLQLRPDVHLIAETGGKNGTIISPLADRDLAIKHLLHSAFSHSGQKCSATSLLLLARELYEDEDFKAALADAAESLPVGSAWDLSTRVGPLIRPPAGVLEQGMKELESGEEWLVMPRRVGDNRQLYRVGIKWNVQPGSFTHTTELFGPVLGVMPFDRLEQAIASVNATGYGLTSGLESLDDREQALWRDSIKAGNLYINRSTTGAVVLRQPFGGIGSSGYGPGAKAGGPHYVLPLMRIENVDRPIRDAESLLASIDDLPLEDAMDVVNGLAALKVHIDTDRAADFAADASRVVKQMLEVPHDHFRLIGQDNHRRYLPVGQLRIRLLGDETPDDVLLSLLAATAARCCVTYSVPHEHHAVVELVAAYTDLWPHTAASPPYCEWLEESEQALAAEIADGRVDRLRTFVSKSQLSPLIHEACHDAFISILDEPVVGDAEIECLRYVWEQSISHDHHRYGNLGRRKVAGRSRSPRPLRTHSPTLPEGE